MLLCVLTGITTKKINVFNLDIGLVLSFEDTLKISSECFISDLFDLKFGAKLYEVGKEKPPQTKEDAKSRVYESISKIDKDYIQSLRARNVQKYCLKKEEYYVKYGDNLAAPRSLSIFIGERILVQRIVTRKTLDATRADEILICSTDIITLKPKINDTNTRLYLAILGSRLCAFILKSQNVNLDRNAFPKINTETLSTFPIPKYTSEHDPIVSLVDRILAAKQADPDADTIALEREIDRLVYQLYGLSEEEILIVENS